jgi:hypothetical protein
VRKLAFVVGSLFAAYLLFTLNGCPEYFDEDPYNPRIDLLLTNELPCVEMTPDERAKAKAVLEILRVNPNGQMIMAAIKFFADAQYRLVDKLTDSHILCRDPDIDASVTALSFHLELFDTNYLNGDMLHLASWLGPRDPAIVNAVGRTAFFPREPPLAEGDVRPLARLVLAQYGRAAAPWSDEAFAAMSSDDLAGTTAARIAIMTDHPGAINKAAELVTQVLKKHPYGDLGHRARRRLTELAIAMAIAGPKAEPYVGALIAASRRRCLGYPAYKGQDPRDLLPGSEPPDYLCWPLKVIGGEKAEEVLRQPWCHPIPPRLPYLRPYPFSATGADQASP